MRKILLVEDDILLSNLYKEFLSSEGFEVLTARDKNEGLNLALQEDISLILLDVILASKTSGLDLLKELREDEKGKEIPVIVLTNVAKDKEKNLALKLGAKDYLVKAAQNPEVVVTKIKKYL